MRLAALSPSRTSAPTPVGIDIGPAPAPTRVTRPAEDAILRRREGASVWASRIAASSLFVALGIGGILSLLSRSAG